MPYQYGRNFRFLPTRSQPLPSKPTRRMEPKTNDAHAQKWRVHPICVDGEHFRSVHAASVALGIATSTLSVTATRKGKLTDGREVRWEEDCDLPDAEHE